MSYANALAKAKRLKAVMLDYGVPEVSIELQTGRPNPYDPWDGLFVVADMSHHIVSNYRPPNLTPLLWLVKEGRTSVPGPLANGYGGWDLCYRILCFSYANHPGAGGPRTVPRVGGGTYTIPKDSARRYVWGTEYEGGVVAADWDRLLRNPRNGKRMTMREFMGRAGAAIHDFFNNPSGAHMEHSTWAPLRKIDRLHYTASAGVAEEKRYADAPPPLPEDDMPAPKDWDDEDWGAFASKILVKDPLDGEKSKSLGTILRHWLRKPVADLPRAVWQDHQIARVNPDGSAGEVSSAEEHLRWTRRSADVAQARSKDVLDALAPILEAAADGQPVTLSAEQVALVKQALGAGEAVNPT